MNNKFDLMVQESYLTAISDFTIEKEFIYYDEPLLFTVRSKLNNDRYLVFVADDEYWWFTLITDEIYKQLINGKIDVRDVICSNDKILELQLKDSSVFQRDNVDLPIDKLPEVGFRLKPE
jgi:hypothetical protein